jgi:8-amino-3,8-dideoxy-alpha-D-manno-octulosonate transaminase
MAKLDLIKAFCDKNGLVLMEDACQSVGASFKGKALGTFGKMGCFSFDPVKTITCGEGGAVITDSEDLYQIAEAFSDHGHDHIGNDRGMEGHSMMGTNFRISELNAAVGLSQLRKLDGILERQRIHKKKLKEVLSGCKKVSFREIPDPEGDSATFLSFFLPDDQMDRKASELLAKEGVDNCIYWYDNNWHYIRQWAHLKTLSFAAKPPIMLSDHCPDYSQVFLPRSDEIMGRNLSMLIKLSWDEKEVNRYPHRENPIFLPKTTCRDYRNRRRKRYGPGKGSSLDVG